VTAWRALFQVAQLKRPQAIFVNGCLRNVGLAAVLSNMIGANIAGSCRGDAIAEARALGIG